jgi:hypothetical protein
MQVIMGNDCIDGVWCSEEMVFAFSLASIPEVNIAFISQVSSYELMTRMTRLIFPRNVLEVIK